MIKFHTIFSIIYFTVNLNYQTSRTRNYHKRAILTYPDGEKLFDFKYESSALSFTESLDSEAHILVGVRPCDLKAIHLMGLSNKDGTGDKNYLLRRKKTIISRCRKTT